uniref:Putative ovule protein n=1 Tax=Solanum chacoense TaxID=4108 RepID=A0A0V0HAR6_SOLCH
MPIIQALCISVPAFNSSPHVLDCILLLPTLSSSAGSSHEKTSMITNHESIITFVAVLKEVTRELRSPTW